MVAGTRICVIFLSTLLLAAFANAKAVDTRSDPQGASQPSVFERAIRQPVFTSDEMAWMQDNPTIRVGGLFDMPPYSFEKDGALVGYSVDYLSLISELTGLNFEYDNRPDWSEQLQLAEARNLDLLHMIRKREGLSRFMLFTEPYLSGGPTVLYGRDGHHKVSSISRITDKTIAVRRDYLEQVYLSHHFSELDLLVVDSTREGINALLSGDADYFVCHSETCDSYIYQNFISNLTVLGHLGIAELENNNQSRFAIRDDWPLLHSILNKAIATISEEQHERLKKRWFNKLEREQLLIETLTDSEKRWIESHRRLAFSLPLKLAPFSFVEGQQPKGMAADIVYRFENEYAIDVHYTHHATWTDIVGAVMSGEIDFVPSMNITEERKQSLLFSNPYTFMEAAIFVKTGEALYTSLSEASGKTMGITKRSAWVSAIKRDYPDITLVEFATLADTLTAVAEEDVDFTILDPYVAQHQMTKLALDLTEAGMTEYKQPVAIAIHPSKPELVSLFNKLIANTDEAQIGLMLEKWNNLHVVEKKDWLPTLAWGGAAAFALVFVILLVGYLNRRESLLTMHKITQRLENAQRVAMLGSWDVESDNRITTLSAEAANILGLAETKTLNRIDYVQMIHEDDRHDYLVKLEESLSTGLLNVVYRIRVNDDIKWVKEVSELVFDGTDNFLSASTTIQDISDFKAQQAQLVERQEELRDLTSKLLSVQEEERRRVARELHDDLSQRLAVLSIDLGALLNKTESEQVKATVQKVKKDIVGIAEDTHSLSRRLHPSIIDDLGLVEALRSEIENYQRREDINVEFFSTMQSLRLKKNVELVIFRVVQEALRNVAKYSEASLVKVNLANVQNTIFLQIQDDGMGFDVEMARKSPGLGLKSMMERARLINATFHISSEENKGVSIELQIPIENDTG